MISITVEIDETDLDDFIHVYTAGTAELAANRVHINADAHKRIQLSRIFKRGLAIELDRFPRATTPSQRLRTGGMT